MKVVLLVSERDYRGIKCLAQTGGFRNNLSTESVRKGELDSHKPHQHWSGA